MINRETFKICNVASGNRHKGKNMRSIKISIAAIVLLNFCFIVSEGQCNMLRLSLSFQEEKDKNSKEWKMALENSKLLPPEILSRGVDYPEVYRIKDELKDMGIEVDEWEIPVPQNLSEIAKEFMDKNRWANYSDEQKNDVQKLIPALPPSLKVYGVHFVGTGNNNDPALVVVGGGHPNEKSSIPSAIWFISRMLETPLENGGGTQSLISPIGDIVFLKKYFSHILVVIPNSPIGYALGLRMGYNGDMTRFIEAFASEETKALLVDRCREKGLYEDAKGCASVKVKLYPEHKSCNEWIKKVLGHKFNYRSHLFIIDFHDLQGYSKAIFGKEPQLIADGDIDLEAMSRIGTKWHSVMENAGRKMTSYISAPLRQDVSPGIAMSNILNSDINPGLNFHTSFTIEGGSDKLGERMQEHHLSMIVIAESIINMLLHKVSVNDSSASRTGI